MTRKDATVFLQGKRDEGYLTFSTILELYEEDQEVPDNVLKYLYTKPEPKEYPIFTSAEGIERFNNVIKEEYVKQTKM